jgi:hypothetical protein
MSGQSGIWWCGSSWQLDRIRYDESTVNLPATSGEGSSNASSKTGQLGLDFKQNGGMAPKEVFTFSLK